MSKYPYVIYGFPVLAELLCCSLECVRRGRPYVRKVVRHKRKDNGLWEVAIKIPYYTKLGTAYDYLIMFRANDCAGSKIFAWELTQKLRINNGLFKEEQK